MANKFKSQILKNEKGFTMVLALFIVFILLLLITTMLTINTSEYKIAINTDKKNQSYYAADAGLNWLIMQFEEDKSGNYFQDMLDGTIIKKSSSDISQLDGIGSFTVTKLKLNKGIEDDVGEQEYHFQITGEQNGVITTFDLEIQQDGKRLSIENWHEN